MALLDEHAERTLMFQLWRSTLVRTLMTLLWHIQNSSLNVVVTSSSRSVVTIIITIIVQQESTSRSCSSAGTLRSAQWTVLCSVILRLLFAHLITVWVLVPAKCFVNEYRRTLSPYRASVNRMHIITTVDYSRKATHKIITLRQMHHTWNVTFSFIKLLSRTRLQIKTP